MDTTYTYPPTTTTTSVEPTAPTTTVPVTTEPATTVPPTTTTTTTKPPPPTTTTTTQPPPTTTTTTYSPPTTTTTTTKPLPPTTTSSRTRTTRTRSTTTTSYSPTTTSNSDPIITTTSSTTSSGTIVSPTLSPSSEKSGMSTGAIVGIVIAALLLLVAALISAFLIKRRRNRTSDTLFNPVNNNAILAMQENQHYHPASPRKDYPDTSGGSGEGGLRGRESVEPLNAHSVATTMLVNGNNRVSSGGSDNSGDSSAIAAASGLQDGGLYPFEADPGYSRHYHNGGAAGVSYLPPTEPAYSQYGGWNDPTSTSENNMMPGVGPADYPTDPAEAAAYAQYEQEQQDLYLHQLMMMQQHGQDQGDILQAPVEYYDPRTSTDYYSSSSSYPQPPPVMANLPSQSSSHHYEHNPQSDENRSTLGSLASGSVTSPIAATAMAPVPPTSTPAAQPTTATTATATTTSPPSAINSPSASEPRSVQDYYNLTENDIAYTSKSEPWASPKRNPQVLIPPAAASASGTREADDQMKVQGISEPSPYANDAMTRPT